MECYILLVLVFTLNSGIGADIGTFWHVSDFHYDHTYWTKQLSCNQKVPRPGKYGDYWCDSPWALVQDSITSMAEIKRDVDFILWTGDNVGHIKDRFMSLKKNLANLQNTTTALNSSFPGVAVYPTLGNHDFYPSDQASSHVSEFYIKMAEMWRGWIQDKEQIEFFKKGGYYQKLIRPKLRLLALNTVLYLKANKATKSMTDPAGQFQWMDDVLQAARAAGEKVLVTGHVPPTFLTPPIMDWFHPEFHPKYLQVMFKYSDIIIAQHYGHDHSDSFKILQRKDLTGASAVFMAPSVTPWRYKIPKETGDPHNPGIRLVEYDRDTGRHLNYQQYYINLTESNRENKTHWTVLYDFQDTYKVPDMSLESLREIYDHMKKPNSLPMQHYCNHLVVSEYNQSCPIKKQAEIWCGGQICEMQRAKHCAQSYGHQRNERSSSTLEIVLAFILHFFNIFK